MRHARPSKHLGLKIAVAGSAAGMGTVAMAALAPTAAHAATGATSGQWERVAACESSGDWSIDTGNGYYGGLQFSASTWDGYGGTAYAPYANEASPADQMVIADRVLAAQGWGAWPVCSRYAGAPDGGAVATPTATAPVAQAAAVTPAAVDTVDSSPVLTAAPATGAVYVVRPGDNLVRIAASHRVAGGWRALYAKNRAVIGDNPNFILPGMRFTL